MDIAKNSPTGDCEIKVLSRRSSSIDKQIPTTNRSGAFRFLPNALAQYGR